MGAPKPLLPAPVVARNLTSCVYTPPPGTYEGQDNVEARVAAHDILQAQARVEARFLGRKASLIGGRHHGRWGWVDGVILEPRERDPVLLLVYIERADGSGPLNSDAWTRSYWPLRSLFLYSPDIRKPGRR